MKILVVAKEPLPGRVKTRLCPPCTPSQAAALAEAALADTLEAALASAADQVVLVLDGRPGVWCPPGVHVVSQCAGAFGQRLASAWAHAEGPAVQIGMDTPQVAPSHLDAAMAMVDRGDDDGAVIGLASDGGWWLLGMTRICAGMFDGVPMSADNTGAAQIARLRSLGRRVVTTATLRDLDTIDDLSEVVAAAPPSGRFRAAVGSIAWTGPEATMAGTISTS